MKKTIILTMAVALLLVITFTFNSNQTRIVQAQSVKIETQSMDQSILEENGGLAVCYAEPSLYEMYHKALSYIMNLDAALNADMDYIAVDYEVEISESNKQAITKALKSYGVKVFEADLEILSDSEYSDEFGNLHGILIRIETVEISESISISFTKYKSGMGSISAEVKMIQNENGEWEVGESDEAVLAS